MRGEKIIVVRRSHVGKTVVSGGNKVYIPLGKGRFLFEAGKNGLGLCLFWFLGGIGRLHGAWISFVLEQPGFQDLI